MGASLEFMKLTGYTDENFQTAFAGQPYSVMMNPDTIKWQQGIDYNSQQAPDKSTPSQKYKSTPSQKLSFDIVIDCTGIVDSSRTNMVTEINALQKIVYTYNGDIHRPNFVKIQWGQNITFNGVLDSLDTSFTLFKPDGSPLRAKISLSFSQYVSPATATKQAAPKSPDLTHVLTVSQTVNLPQMCQKIWNDHSLYVEVAKYNGLNKFRNLKSGQKLLFPPVIQPN
jgi:Contractile injection system tube protein